MTPASARPVTGRPALVEISAPAPTGAAAVVPAMPGAGAPPLAALPGAGAEPAPAIVAPPPLAGPPAAAAPLPGGEIAAAVPGPPAAERPAPREFGEAPQLADIHFDFDRHDIRPRDAEILRSNAAWLRSHRETLVLIEGHCDERGTNQYNLALGDRRARATRDFLVAHGVAADRIALISYGEERPACIERGETCWARNRRAHFLTRPQ